MEMKGKSVPNSGGDKEKVADKIKRINVIISGLTGDMAMNVAMKVQTQPDMELARIALTGEGMTSKVGNVIKLGRKEIVLIEPKVCREALEKYAAEECADAIIVDFTAPLVKGQPSPAKENAKLYCSLKRPFVMGSTTTKEDSEEIRKMVIDSGNLAVIAPNMAPLIVIFQDMMTYAATKYAGALEGYFAHLVESHQGPKKREAAKLLRKAERKIKVPVLEHIGSVEELDRIMNDHPEVGYLIKPAMVLLNAGKKDTSGTMRSVLKDFQKLGIDVNDKDIQMIRDEDIQEHDVKVPEKYLRGHAYHWYNILSPDKTVNLGFLHLVNGRDVYGWGALTGVRFIDKKRQAGVTGAFTMIDVLSEGAQ